MEGNALSQREYFISKLVRVYTTYYYVITVTYTYITQ